MPINPPSGAPAAGLCALNLVVACVPNPVPVGMAVALVGTYCQVQNCGDPHWIAWTEIRAWREDPLNPGEYIWKVLGKSAGTPIYIDTPHMTKNWTTAETLKNLGFSSGEIAQVRFVVRCESCKHLNGRIFHVPVVA